MAIAHTCNRCGLDLAHTPVRREPIYGWPLVVCPGCAAPAVRREHQARRGFRVARKWIRAVLGLVLRAAFIALLTPLTMVATHELGVTSSPLASAWLPAPLAALGLDRSPEVLARRDQWLSLGDTEFLLVMTPIACAAASVLLRGLLRHWATWACVLVWMLWLGFWSGMIHTVAPSLELMLKGLPGAASAFARGLEELSVHVPWIVAAGVLTYALSPFGSAAVWVARSMMRPLRRSMKRKLRMRRQSV